MRRIRIVPSMSSRSESTMDKESTIKSKSELKRALNYDYDDEDTVTSTTGHSESMSSDEVMGESVVSSGSEEAYESLSKQRVSFGTLEIHEHAMELGGAGIPRLGGAPVTMSWERQAYYAVPVEEYDDLKGPSRTGEELFLNQKYRMTILLESGFTMQEIHSATAAADQIRIRRQILACKGPSPLKKIKGVIKKFVGNTRHS